MDKLIPIFKEKKIRVTPQRLEVYLVLNKNNQHLTVEQIYGRVKEKFPAISLATVYSILDLFKDHDLTREVRIEFDKSYFEIKTDSHHHFFCRQCGKTYDLDLHCEHLQKKAVDGHRIEDFQGCFYGICTTCQQKQ
ncbi:MAG: transcriptional repressor [Candidatus Omnitrophica bacterium]|nr:transcriptional repressor [Candidatus Omnitrophota bacterium]